jgi:endonuclease/exonuclease/phosphatase family metal-dependent hydrolase
MFGNGVQMIFASWNVNNGSANDRTAILRDKFAADVVALQECSQPLIESASTTWHGDLALKGLSVSFDGGLQRLPHLDNSSPSIATTIVGSALGDFNVLAIWAKPTPTYFEDVMATLDAHRAFIAERPTVILGDFNLDVRIRGSGRQFYVVNARLNHDFNLFSAYHEFNDERFGMETMPTLYFKWGYKGCFHCDYIYVPAPWLSRITNAFVAPYRDWESSDHRSVICNIA